MTAWAHEAAGADEALRTEFEAVNARVVQSMRDFVAWLETDLKPHAHGLYAIGPEHFLAKLRYEEQVELPLPELLARGEARLQRDYDAFVQTAARIDPKRTPAEVMKSLSDDHPSAEDLVPSVRRSVEAARRYVVEKGIVTIPSEVRPRIEETPPYARSGSFASMDTPGAYETKATEAFYYVTPVENDWDPTHREEHLRLYNPPVVAMINVHEAFPGHFLQFLYAQRFPTKTRKLLYCRTNVEGWAHYCEQMMVDQGFGGDDPRFRLTQLQAALLRDCRYVVGIKLHTQGMTVEDGAKIFEQKAFQEPANAYEEARRGAYNPTYLSYTFGKLQIQDLRDEYRARTGRSLRDFHDAFVAQGGLPFPLMRRILLHDVPRSAASSRARRSGKSALSPSGAFRKASQFVTLDVPGELYRRQWDQRGVPIATEKKQRTWPEGPVSRRFTFSKPVFEGLIREIAFENGYREPRARRIASSLPKVLGLLDYRRSREGLPGKIVVFCSVAIGSSSWGTTART